MRNLFLALVLANLAFAAWHNWFSPEPPTVLDGAAQAPGITLASEAPDRDRIDVVSTPVAADPQAVLDVDAALEPDTQQPLAASGAERDPDVEPALPDTVAPTVAVTSPPPAVPAPSTERACLQVGPFRELSQVATAAANLRANGFEPQQRAGEGDIWVGYWVYIDGLGSVAEAEEVLGALKDSGMTDPYVIPQSDSGTLISLGVYSEIARASSRREQVRQLGYDATISDRMRRATVYWIEVMLPVGELIDFEQLQPPGRIVRLEQRPCVAPA